jgi:hypothetical protein
MAWGGEAYALIAQILEEVPCNGHLPWRIYLAEPLYQASHMPQLLIKLTEFMDQLKREWNVPTMFIEATLAETTATLLVQFLDHHNGLVYNSSSLSCQSNRPSKRRAWRFERFRKRLHEAHLTMDWRAQAMDLMEWLDKTYRWRTRWGNRWRRPCVTRSGITFFSSYLNNSRILASFVDSMPGKVNWVLTNDSARKGLPPNNQNYSWIWQFANSQASNRMVAEPVMDFPEKGAPASFHLLKAWLTGNGIWEGWQAVEIPLLARLTHCWEAYLDRAEPRLIVMANQWGIEGSFTQIARQRGIPVLQVMHGVLGGYLHTQTPIISDAMVVYGEFWRNLWPEDQREKIIIYNPAEHIPKVRRSPSFNRRCLSFFSLPLSLAPFYNSSEFLDGFIHLFQNLVSQEGYDVIVRVHPLENTSDFVERWRHWYGSIPPSLHLSKRDPLSEILARTDVALMFRSTVMLNCLASGIPVVMPRWIDFGWNQELVNLPGLCLARDFPDLEHRITEWLNQPPQIPREAGEYFVRSPGRGRSDFRSWLDGLIASGNSNQ